LLDSEAAVLGYAANRTYNGVNPGVHRCTEQYATEVKLTKAERKRLEERSQRKAGPEKWAIEIVPPPTGQIFTGVNGHLLFEQSLQLAELSWDDAYGRNISLLG
jgi:hypothetical protein